MKLASESKLETDFLEALLKDSSGVRWVPKQNNLIREKIFFSRDVKYKLLNNLNDFLYVIISKVSKSLNY